MVVHVVASGRPGSVSLVGLCGAPVEGFYVSKIVRAATRANTCPVCRSLALNDIGSRRDSSRPTVAHSGRAGREA
jgi:hypothetical protein